MCALLHRALVAAVVLVAATLPALSQGVGLVSGRVTDERGVPLKGAVVTLSGPAVLGSQAVTTDQGGRYRFRAVPGNHPLTVTAATPGRVPLMYVGHMARRDGNTSIDFTLRLRGEVEVLALVEEGVPYHQTALEGAISVMPGNVTTLSVRDAGPETVRQIRERLDRKPSAVLAIGDLAARLARRYIRDVPVVYSMVPAPFDSDLSTANLCGVPLNGGFDTQIEHLRHLLPEAKRIGTLVDPRRMGHCLKEARQTAETAGVDLIAANVYGDRPEEVEAALGELADRDIDAFLLLLDPRLMDADVFEQIVRFVENRDVVLAVPDASLVVPGKTFSFGPGFHDLGVYSGMLVRRIVEGKAQPSQIGITYPNREALGGVATRQETRTFREMLPSSTLATELRIARDE